MYIFPIMTGALYIIPYIICLLWICCQMGLRSSARPSDSCAAIPVALIRGRYLFGKSDQYRLSLVKTDLLYFQWVNHLSFPFFNFFLGFDGGYGTDVLSRYPSLSLCR